MVLGDWERGLEGTKELCRRIWGTQSLPRVSLGCKAKANGMF